MCTMILTLLVLASSQAFGNEEKPILLSFAYLPYLDGKGGGVIEQLLAKSMKEEGVELEIHPLPSKRALKEFERQEPNQIIVLGSLYKKNGYNKNYVQLPLVNSTASLAYDKKRFPKWGEAVPKVDSLQIGILRGASNAYYKNITSVYKYEVSSNDSGILMLKRGRIEAFYAAH